MQAGPPHFGPWENHGASPLGTRFWAHKGEEGYWEQSTCLTNLIAFCDGTSGFVDEGTAEDIIYLDFIRAFGTVSHNILVPKLRCYSLCGCTTKQVGVSLDDEAQRVMVIGHALHGGQ